MEFKPKDKDFFKTSFYIARQEFLRRFESFEEGINREQIIDFINQFKDGFEPADIIFLREEDIPSLREQTKNYVTLNPNQYGTYFPELNIAVIIRYRELEELNGITFSEAAAVHETAHSLSNHRDLKINKGRIDEGDTMLEVYLPRTGFQLARSNEGYFFEEAFAEYLAGMYTERYRQQEVTEAIVSGIQKMIADPTIYVDAQTKITWQIEGQVAQTFPKYITIRKEGLRPTDSGFAASGIDILKSIYPDIDQLLITARSSLEGLEELKSKINALEPELYARLEKISPNQQEIMSGCMMIRDAIKKARKKVN